MEEIDWRKEWRRRRRRQGWELKEGRQVGGSQARSRTGKKWNTRLSVIYIAFFLNK